MYIIPVIMYGADVWSLTVASQRRLDAFDQWCLWHILRIPYTAHVSNSEVHSRTGQPPITTVIKQRRLELFGHVVQADQAEDHNRALRASLNPPSNWRRPRGRPRQTWLRTISDDLKHLYLGLRLAYLQAQGRSSWRKTVETAMLTVGMMMMMMMNVKTFVVSTSCGLSCSKSGR